VRSSFWHPCRPSRDATPPSQATVTPRYEPRPPSPCPREETERVDDPGVPSFGRTLGLPSAWSIPIPALRRGCDPVNVHGAVRPAIASSSRAPWASTFRCGSGGCHPRPEPPPTRLLHDARSVAAGPRRSWLSPGPDLRRGTTSFQTGFSGLATAYRSLQRMIDARARPRAVNPPPREAPASVRVRGS
jgi:hypothetical protein